MESFVIKKRTILKTQVWENEDDEEEEEIEEKGIEKQVEIVYNYDNDDGKEIGNENVDLKTKKQEVGDRELPKENKRKKVKLEESKLIEIQGQKFYEEAIELAVQGNTQRALQRLANSIMLFPTNSKAHEARAQLLMDQGEYFEAIRSVQRAIEIDNHWETAYFTLGRAQTNFGEIELALESFEKSFKLFKRNEQNLMKSKTLQEVNELENEIIEEMNKTKDLFEQKRTIELKNNIRIDRCRYNVTKDKEN